MSNDIKDIKKATENLLKEKLEISETDSNIEKLKKIEVFQEHVDELNGYIEIYLEQLAEEEIEKLQNYLKENGFKEMLQGDSYVISVKTLEKKKLSIGFDNYRSFGFFHLIDETFFDKDLCRELQGIMENEYFSNGNHFGELKINENKNFVRKLLIIDSFRRDINGIKKYLLESLEKLEELYNEK